MQWQSEAWRRRRVGTARGTRGHRSMTKGHEMIDVAEDLMHEIRRAGETEDGRRSAERRMAKAMYP